MKQISEEKLLDIMKLKFGKIVDEPGHTAYVSNKVLGKIFQVSRHAISNDIRLRYEKLRL